MENKKETKKTTIIIIVLAIILIISLGFTIYFAVKNNELKNTINELENQKDENEEQNNLDNNENNDDEADNNNQVNDDTEEDNANTNNTEDDTEIDDDYEDSSEALENNYFTDLKNNFLETYKINSIVIYAYEYDENDSDDPIKDITYEIDSSSYNDLITYTFDSFNQKINKKLIISGPWGVTQPCDSIDINYSYNNEEYNCSLAFAGDLLYIIDGQNTKYTGIYPSSSASTIFEEIINKYAK